MPESTQSRELRQLVAHLQSAYRLAHVGSWEADVRNEGLPDVYWSPEAHVIAGLPPDQPPTYRDFVAILHPDDRAIFLEGHSSALSGERPYDMDLRVIRPDGEQRRIRIAGEVIRDEHGEPVRVVGTAQDQTEQIEGLRQLRMTEVARRDLLQRLLVTADIERGRLARHLASGPIDRLVEIEQRMAAQLPEEASDRWLDALAAIRKAIDSLHQTLTDIEGEPSSGDLPQLVHDVATETLPGMLVTSDVASGISLRPPVQATMLRVMQEALHNVRKHAHATRTDVRWHVEDGFVHVVVSDDGRGFDLDAVERRAGHLGIVSMRDRLTELGGRLEIRSRPGRTVVDAAVPLG